MEFCVNHVQGYNVSCFYCDLEAKAVGDPHSARGWEIKYTELRDHVRFVLSKGMITLTDHTDKAALEKLKEMVK